jgi:hypothetical protein
MMSEGDRSRALRRWTQAPPRCPLLVHAAHARFCNGDVLRVCIRGWSTLQSSRDVIVSGV